MKLKDSPFKTAKGLCDLSDLLINAINAVNKVGSFTIEKHPIQLDDDQLEYWKENNHIYGLWLRCICGCKLSTSVDFWMGLQIESDDIHIIISFLKKGNQAQPLKSSQSSALTSSKHIIKSPNTTDIWAELNEVTDLPRLTDPRIFSGQKEQVLQDFLQDVLGRL
jgi:hypothetical protein